MQLNETVRASSGFHHSTRSLAPGENLPLLPSLFEQVMACRNGMTSKATNEEAEPDDFADESLEEELDEELDS